MKLKDGDKVEFIRPHGSFPEEGEINLGKVYVYYWDAGSETFPINEVKILRVWREIPIEIILE